MMGGIAAFLERFRRGGQCRCQRSLIRLVRPEAYTRSSLPSEPNRRRRFVFRRPDWTSLRPVKPEPGRGPRKDGRERQDRTAIAAEYSASRGLPIALGVERFGLIA